VLLSIILDEEKQREALPLWKNSQIKVSSILLKLESLISLRRHYEYNKNNFDSSWLTTKTTQLNEFLCEVTFTNIDTIIDSIIISNNNLAKCRTLDAIHLATALDIRTKNDNNNINLYTFDNNMFALAKEFGFITNQIYFSCRS
jgi:hypothetical protein